MPANYSEEQPVSEREPGKLESLTPNDFYRAKQKIAYFRTEHTGCICWGKKGVSKLHSYQNCLDTKFLT